MKYFLLFWTHNLFSIDSCVYNKTFELVQQRYENVSLVDPCLKGNHPVDYDEYITCVCNMNRRIIMNVAVMDYIITLENFKQEYFEIYVLMRIKYEEIYALVKRSSIIFIQFLNNFINKKEEEYYIHEYIFYIFDNYILDKSCLIGKNVIIKSKQYLLSKIEYYMFEFSKQKLVYQLSSFPFSYDIFPYKIDQSDLNSIKNILNKKNNNLDFVFSKKFTLQSMSFDYDASDLFIYTSSFYECIFNQKKNFKVGDKKLKRLNSITLMNIVVDLVVKYTKVVSISKITSKLVNKKIMLFVNKANLTESTIIFINRGKLKLNNKIFIVSPKYTSDIEFIEYINTCLLEFDDDCTHYIFDKELVKENKKDLVKDNVPILYQFMINEKDKTYNNIKSYMQRKLFEYYINRHELPIYYLIESSDYVMKLECNLCSRAKKLLSSCFVPNCLLVEWIQESILEVYDLLKITVSGESESTGDECFLEYIKEIISKFCEEKIIMPNKNQPLGDYFVECIKKLQELETK